jgi:hypothetical protein
MAFMNYLVGFVCTSALPRILNFLVHIELLKLLQPFFKGFSQEVTLLSSFAL